MPMVTVIKVFCMGMNQLEQYETTYCTVIKKDTFSEFDKILGKGPPVLKIRRKTRKIEENTMASLTTLTDITKPIDTSGWIPTSWKNDPLTKEQKAALEKIKDMEVESEAKPNEKRMTAGAGGQNDGDNWTKVTNKKSNKAGTSAIMESTIKKVKVTVTICAPKDTSNFSPAKLHIDTLHEIHKCDDSLLVINASGDTKVNIEALMSEARYKKHINLLKSVKETALAPLAYLMNLTGKTNEYKEAIFPFLKKNKIFLYFNPKPGLEHFSAIGVLFGPNPYQDTQ
jgi:hypothetical protein